MLKASYNVHHLIRRTFGQVPGGMFGADENARLGYIDPRQGGSGNRQGNPNRAVGRSLQNLDFEFRGDADDTLSQMYDAIRQYGQVSVGDLWDLMGVSNESTDYNYGCTTLTGRSSRASRADIA